MKRNYVVYGFDGNESFVLGEFTHLHDAIRYRQLMAKVYSVVFIQEFVK